MKANLFKILHYVLFTAFFALAGVSLVAPIGHVIVVGALAALFLAHTFTHGVAVKVDLHSQYDEFREIAESLKDKFVGAMHVFVETVEVNPHVAKDAPAFVGLNGDVSKLLASGAADVQKVAKDVEQAVDKATPVAQPDPTPAPTPVAEPAPAAPVPAPAQ